MKQTVKSTVWVFSKGARGPKELARNSEGCSVPMAEISWEANICKDTVQPLNHAYKHV